MVGQDVSARDVQRTSAREPQFSLGKSFPGFGPTGPWLVSRDEFGDEDTQIECLVNGERVQHASTAEMIFPVADADRVHLGDHADAARRPAVHRHARRRRRAPRPAALPRRRRRGRDADRADRRAEQTSAPPDGRCTRRPGGPRSSSAAAAACGVPGEATPLSRSPRASARRPCRRPRWPPCSGARRRSRSSRSVRSSVSRRRPCSTPRMIFANTWR